MDRAPGSLRKFPFVLAASGAFLAVLLLTPSPSSGAPDPTRATLDRPWSASPTLDIDPSTWWMPAGNVTPFIATWIDPTPGCALSTDWFRWSIVGGSAEGGLNSTSGANVTFAATSVVSGVTTLRVRSAVVLACGSETSSSMTTAEANVTVVAPISLQNLSVDSGPDRGRRYRVPPREP